MADQIEDFDDDGNPKPAAADPKVPLYRLTEPAYIFNLHL